MNTLTEGTILASFEQLEKGLREWRSFAGGPEYDLVGMRVLLEACIDNLRQNALPEDIVDIADDLSEEHRDFLKSLLAMR